MLLLIQDTINHTMPMHIYYRSITFLDMQNFPILMFPENRMWIHEDIVFYMRQLIYIFEIQFFSTGLQR